MKRKDEEKLLASMTKYERKKYIKKRKEEQEKKKKLLTKIGIGIAGVLLIAGISFAIYDSKLPVYTIGDEKLSSDEYNFYYNMVLNNFIESNHDYLSYYGLDIEKPLDQQVYDQNTGKTWEDYFIETTDINIQELMSAKIDADKNNYVCEDLDTIVKDYMDGFESAAKEHKLDLDDYIKSIYGDSMSMKEFKECISRHAYITSYLKYKYDGIEVTDKDIENSYNNNKDNYDAVDGFIYNVQAITVTDKDNNKTIDKEATKKKAEELFEKIKNGEDFVKVINDIIPKDDPDKEEYEDGHAVTITKGKKSHFTEEVGKWLYSNDRKENDTTLIFNESDDSYYLVKFTKKYLDISNTVDVKHILISFDTDDKGNKIEGSETKAKEEIDKIKAEFDKNPTVENFELLAAQYSDDPGSASNGGLYEGVAKGDMVDEFDKWIFDETRKEKDVDIIKTEYGYHLMYYVGQNKPSYQLEIINTITSDTYSGWLEGILVEYTKK